MDDTSSVSRSASQVVIVASCRAQVGREKDDHQSSRKRDTQTFRRRTTRTAEREKVLPLTLYRSSRIKTFSSVSIPGNPLVVSHLFIPRHAWLAAVTGWMDGLQGWISARARKNNLSPWCRQPKRRATTRARVNETKRTYLDLSAARVGVNALARKLAAADCIVRCAGVRVTSSTRNAFVHKRPRQREGGRNERTRVRRECATGGGQCKP